MSLARLLRSTFLIVLLLLSLLPGTLADPVGASILSNTTETVTPASAAASATAGGSFTTLILNATTQTPRWKAYVGNVTGRFTLQSADNYTIYDWAGSYVSGEVYSSRHADVSWPGIDCVTNASLLAEQTVLNMTGSQADNINKTFNRTVHKGFFVGTEQLQNSTCRAIATYVGSAAQASTENAKFQEVLLEDSHQYLVFAALIDTDTAGFNNALFDFQMIVPESEYASTPHTYYFWLELS